MSRVDLETVARIEPDFPGDSEICVVSHYGDMALIDLSIWRGDHEVLNLNLDRGQTEAMITALQQSIRLSFGEKTP